MRHLAANGADLDETKDLAAEKAQLLAEEAQLHTLEILRNALGGSLAGWFQESAVVLPTVLHGATFSSQPCFQDVTYTRGDGTLLKPTKE